MECYICKNKIKVEVKDYLAESVLLGEITVPSISQKHCGKCGEIFLSYDSAQKVHEYINRKEQEAILDLPIHEFVFSSEAIEILGVSRQALAKNPDVKNGVIITVNISGKRLYLRRSLELYKINRDGRFQITPDIAKTETGIEIIAETATGDDTTIESQKTQYTVSEVHPKEFNIVYNPITKDFCYGR